MEVDLVSSHIVYQHLNGNLNLLDFKIVIANFSIGKHSNHQRAFPHQRAFQAGPANTPDHLPEYQVSRQQCMYCKTDGKDIKTFVKC